MLRPIPPKLADRLAIAAWKSGELTKREVDCLALIANGRTEAQAGEVMHLSRWTVNTHLKAVRQKLGAHSQAQAVALALVRGLLDADLIARD